jgi:hypothetical protein
VVPFRLVGMEPCVAPDARRITANIQSENVISCRSWSCPSWLAKRRHFHWRRAAWRRRCRISHRASGCDVPLGGSVVGGLISGTATRSGQRFQARAGQLARAIELRQKLYIEFIRAASKACADSLMSDQARIEELATPQAMITRMHLASSPRILACAREVMLATTENYFKPNKTIRELYELTKTGRMSNRLEDFSDAVLEEAGRRYRGGLLSFPTSRPPDGGRARDGTWARSLRGILRNSV